MRHRIRRFVLLQLCLFALGGCGAAPTQPAADPKVRTTEDIRRTLVGTWQYQYKGVTVEVSYTPTTVTLPGVPPTPYVLNGNEITVDVVGAKTSLIEFNGRDEMVQTNKTDGERYVFKRKPSG